MANTFIRTTIIFTVLVVVIRLMGKRQIGEMQPYEFIVTLIIADLACVPMADVSIPLVYGIVAVLTLFVLHQLISLIEHGGDFFKKILSGKPSVVINKQGVDLKELKRNNMDVGDLIESMRSAGYFSLDQLDYAIFESNGKLSALENPNADKSSVSIPVIIVDDGKIVQKNCELLSTTEKQVKDFLLSFGCSVKNTEVLTIDGNGKAYLKAKNDKFRLASFSFSKECKW